MILETILGLGGWVGLLDASKKNARLFLQVSQCRTKQLECPLLSPCGSLRVAVGRVRQTE